MQLLRTVRVESRDIDVGSQDDAEKFEEVEEDIRRVVDDLL
jgi:hypothetical protein